MAAKITVDIEAKVKGYQEAIEQMKAAFAKLDPGTTMAKSIKAGIQSAEAELKSLSRNMFPTASSEGQIDAIINKVNHLGDSIIATADKMKSLGINDLDLSAMDPQIQQLISNLDQLQGKFTETISQGMKETINNSQELSQAFKDLGIELNNNSTTDSILDAVIAKSEEAKQKVTEMEQAFSKAEKKYNTEIGNLTALTNNPLFTNKDQMDKDLQNIASDYTNAINKLKPQLEQGLKSLDIKGGEKKREELLNNFLGGLTPENLRERLMELKNSVQAAAKETLTASEIYKGLFGDTLGRGGNASAIEKALLANIFPSDSVFNDIKTNFLQKLSEISKYLTDAQIGNVQGLLSKGQIDTALEKTLQYLQSAYQTLQGKVVKASQAVYDAIEGKDTARANLEAAKTSSSQTDALYNKLQNQVNDLIQKNSDQQKQIEQLRNEIDERKNKSLDQVKQSGASAAKQASAQIFPTQAAQAYSKQLDQVRAREQMVGKIQGVVQRWFSIYAAVRMVGQAIRSVISTIKELDATITEIAIVTNMTQENLWGQMDTYTKTAREYATSISGVYKVSQLYYQQGLQQSDVMALTEQTLKMARISGLEYATATDYMTNAVRSFKMEMTEAQTVVDVYSSIAASSATSVTELASAMSKTASSAQAVGSSFQNTTAMMAVMIEATRESAENIGSAMKSIISRYGEMTSDPSKLMDSEGEEMSLNRVDKALQTVGISIHDTAGQFRDFDEVIMELAEKWDTIDKNTQRYIATIMAGNRQQSRFLALVSSYDRLKELSQTAADSEDASQLQFLKTLDSVDAKTQQLQTSLQSLYVGAGIEEGYKKILDIVNNIVKSLESLGKTSGLGAVIGKVAGNFTNTALLVTNTFNMIKSRFADMQQKILLQSKLASAEQQAEVAKNLTAEQLMTQVNEQSKTKITLEQAQERVRIRQQETDAAVQQNRKELTDWEATQKQKAKLQRSQKRAMVASAVGGTLTTIAASMDVNESREAKRELTGLGAVLQGIGTGFMIGGTAGSIIGILTAIPGILEAIGMLTESVGEKIQNFNNQIEKTNNNQIKAKSELKTLMDYQKKYQELSTTRYLDDSHEQQWVELNREIVANYPELLGYIDAEGNAVADLEGQYDSLLKKKKEAYESATLEKLLANYQALNDMQYTLSEQITTRANGISTKRNNGIRDFSTNVLGDLWNGFLINRLFGDGKQLMRAVWAPGEEEIASSAETTMQEIAGLMTQAGNNKSEFERLFKEKYNADWNQGNINWTFEGKINTKLTETMKKFTQSIEKNYNNYLETADSYIASNLAEVTDYYGEELEFSKYSFLKDKATKSINEEWIKTKENAEKTGIDRIEAFKNFWTTIPSLLEDFDEQQVGFDTKDLEKAEKIFTQKTKFSINYLTNLTDNLLNEGIENLFSGKQIQELIEYAEKRQDRTKKSLSAIISNANKRNLITDNDMEQYQEFVNSLSNILSQIPIEYIDNYTKQFETLIDSNSYRNSDKTAIIQRILDFQNAILNSNKNQEQKDAASQILASADYTSLSSLFETQTKLKDLGFDIDFSELVNKIIPNINSELQSYATDITKSMSDFEKAISNAAKGMDFKTATEMAQKLGKRLTDFDFRDGKYYFNDLDLINKKYLSDNEEYVMALQKKIQQQNKGYAKYKTYLELWPEDQFDKKITEKKELFGEYGLNVDTIISQHNEFLKASAGERAKGFSQWLINQNNAEAQAAIQASQEYIDYQINTSYLTRGNISEFLKSTGIVQEDSFDYLKYISQTDKNGHDRDFDSRLAEAEQYIATLTDQIASGYIDELPEELAQYASLIYNTYHSVQTNIASQMIGAISGDNDGKIAVTAANLPTLEKLQQQGLLKSGELKEGQFASIADEVINGTKTLDAMWETLQLNEKERVKFLTQYVDALSENKLTGLSTILSDDMAFSSTEFINFLSKTKGVKATDMDGTAELANYAQQYGLKINKATGDYIIENLTQFLEETDKDIESLRQDGATEEEINSLITQQQVLLHQSDAKYAEAFKNITSNYANVSDKQIEDLANSTHLSIETLKSAFEYNDNGTYTLNVNKLKELLNEENLTQETRNLLEELIASISDNYYEAIKNASSLFSSGTTKISEIQKFVSDYQSDINSTATINELFNWNELLEAYTLKPEFLSEYINYQVQELIGKGFDLESAQNIIESQTKKQIDISKFLSSENRESGSKAFEQLSSQIDAWIIAASTTGAGISISLPSELLKEIESKKELVQKPEGDFTIEQSPEWKEAEKRNEQMARESIRNYIIGTLEAGGKAGVELYKEMNSDATSKELEEIYYSQINKYFNFSEVLSTIEKGSFVSQDTAKFLNELGAGFQVDDNGIVVAVGNLQEAYLQIYNKIKDSAEKTTSQLNTAYAKYLTSTEQGDIDAIAAMGDAMGMTYDTLGQLLGKYDEDLETWMGNNEDLYTKIGNGKIRITDFDSFLRSVPGLKDIDKNSEEYLSAFNAYNDSLVALNRQTEKNILEEVQNVMSAKGGDQINLTYLSSKLGETAELVLSGTLQQYGASLTDGILTIREGANLVAITQEIISTATEAADLLPEEIADLKDAISKALQSFTDAINNGISGKLTERGKLDLQTMAKNYLGIDASQLTFTQTVDGLKLSQQSAILLYQELKKIDKLQASLVFDDLNKSLQDNNEHYKNVSDIMNRIKYLQDEIAKADGTVSNARRQEYEAELAVAKEILAVRSTSEDSSFNFMSNKIPGGQNNPLNYYSSWQKAIKTIEDGVKVKGKKNKTQYAKGFIDYQDFYNIATEMNNLAKISGQKFVLAGTTLDGSMKAASELIEKGAASLQAVDTGELKVNLKSVGLDILGGANSLSEGVDAGIHAMAQSQIDMLDGLISLLETITAMEDLGDVAAESGDDLEIELPDIQIKGSGFDENGKPVTNSNEYGFTKAFYNWRKAKLAEIEEGKTGFAKAAKEVKIAGKSLEKIIAQKAGEWTKDQAKILNSLWKAAKNGDWDVDNVAESMKKVLADAGLGNDANLTIDVGKTHYIVQGGAVVQSINFESDGAKKSLDKLTKKGGKFAGEVEKAKKYITNQVDAYTKGNPNNVKLDYTLIAEATGQLKYDKKSKKNYVTFQGTKYYGEEAIAKAMRGKEVAKALGINENKVTYEEGKDIPNGKHSGKKTITLKDKSTVTYEMSIDSNGKTSWTVTDGKGNIYKGNSKENALKQWFNKISKVDENNGKRYVDINGHKYTFEQWMEVNFDTRVNTTTRFFGEGGKKLNISKSAGAQAVARDLLLKSNEELAKLVTPGKNGISQIKVDNFTLEFDTSTITTGGEANGDLVRQQLMAALGLDTNLAETITNGIVQAIPSISDAIKKLGENKETADNVKTLASALSSLFTSLTKLNGLNLNTLKTQLSAFLKDLNKNEELKLSEDLPAITGHAKELQVTYDKLVDGGKAAAGNGEGAAEGSKAADFELSYAVTASTGTLEVDASTAEKKLKEGQTVTIQLKNADGTAANLTITEITGDKTANNVTDVTTGDVSATASNINLSANDGNYHLEFKKINADGEVEVSTSVDIPANILFGGNATDLQSYLTSQGVPQTDIELITTTLDNQWAAWKEKNKSWAVSPQIGDQDLRVEQLQNYMDGTSYFSEDPFENRAKAFELFSGILGDSTNIDDVINALHITPDNYQDYQSLLSMEGKEFGISFNGAEFASTYDEFIKGLQDYITVDIQVDPDSIIDLKTYLDSTELEVNTKIQVSEEDLASFANEFDIDIDLSTEEGIAKAKQDIIDFVKEKYGITVEVTEFGADDVEEAGKEASEDQTSVVTFTETGASLVKEAGDEAAEDRTSTITYRYTTVGAPPAVGAKGNVSLAAGNAMASGTKTLMGELGPELVVSHGRYFIAGQNGAEFVDLDKDAIVFNHLQTESLLKNGKAGRGKAKTNERNAVGMATGNVNGGPALASASSALNALKQLRAMWKSLLDASVQDMASKAGSGGGGGGGGDKKNKGFMKEVERWYTLMQRIAQLEKDINYQEQLRNKIMSDRNGTGKQYWLSQKKSLNNLGQEISYQKELAISQQSYFDKRRAELNKQSGFSKLYTFDASGQLVYNDKATLKNGKKGGLSFLSDLFATDTKTGAAKYTDEQKYKKLIDAGLVGSKAYDENGNLIKKPKKGAKKDKWNTYYTEVVKSFSSKMDADKEEMQKLHDSIDDANEKVLELEQQRNEILNEMRDKYLELEDQVFNAVKELKQRAIDELQDLRDATEKSNQKYLDGLNAALQSEQNMYQKNESRNELDKMRRQLAILQRSGGSASQIASLQNDIRSKEKDQYFDERQSQIDAIQKASDNQIKKMDQQIEIMQKTLDYQVKYGLLWNDVDDIMKKSPKEIADFIKKNSSDYWGKSSEALKKANDELARLIDYVAASNQQRKLLESVKQVDEQWKGSATTVWDKDKKQWKIQYNGQGTKDALKKQYSKKVWDAASAEAEKQYYATYNRTGDPKAAAKAARKVLDAEKKKQEPAKEPTKEPGKTDDKKGGKGGKKTTAQLGRYQNKNGKTTFIGWYTLKAGQKTPPAPTVKDYKCINTNSNVPSSGAVAGKTYKVTYTYSKNGAQHGWVVTGTAQNGTKIRQEFSLENYKNSNSAKVAAQTWLNNNKKNARGRKLSLTSYKRGGQVDYTGFAQVDGTPSRPEAFFNAEQTKILKNGLLGNSSRILASTLEEFNSIVEGMANGATYNTIDRGSSLVIENASVNMNVQSIANDYDARRAGEQALEQMMRIARKSGTKGVSRR